MEYRTTLGMLTVLAVVGKEIKGRSMFSVSTYIAFQMDHIKKKTKVRKGNKGKIYVFSFTIYCLSNGSYKKEDQS